MEMTGEQLIPVPQAEVWRALNDPEVLKACIPGCETIEKVSDNEYRILITAAVGPVKAKFTGKLVLSDLNRAVRRASARAARRCRSRPKARPRA